MKDNPALIPINGDYRASHNLAAIAANVVVKPDYSL